MDDDEFMSVCDELHTVTKRVPRSFCWCASFSMLIGLLLLNSRAPTYSPAVMVEDGAEETPAQVSALIAASSPPPPPAARCGNGKCEAPEEDMKSCFADCPGVTTSAMCGEEPHSDPGGYAVVWGASHKKASAAECCEACTAHAADPKNSKRPCNSWCVVMHRRRA